MDQIDWENFIEKPKGSRNPYMRTIGDDPPHPAEKPNIANFDNPLNPNMSSYNSTAKSRLEGVRNKEPAKLVLNIDHLPSQQQIVKVLKDSAMRRYNQPQTTPTPSSGRKRARPSPVETQMSSRKHNITQTRNEYPQLLELKKRKRPIPEPASEASGVEESQSSDSSNESDPSQDGQYHVRSANKEMKGRKPSTETASLEEDESDPSVSQLRVTKSTKKKTRLRKGRSQSVSSGGFIHDSDKAGESPVSSDGDKTDVGNLAPKSSNKSRGRSSGKKLDKESERERKERNRRKNAYRPPPGSHLGWNPDGTRQRKIRSQKVPLTWDDAGEADRMMFQWKNQGKPWDDIRHEWERITGIRVGHSTLSVRWLKLHQNLSKHGGADDLRLIKFKKEADEELINEIWSRVATKITADGGHDYAPAVLAKRYAALERNGFALTSSAPHTELKEEESDEEEGGIEAVDRHLAGLDNDDHLTGLEYDSDNESTAEVEEDVQEDFQEAVLQSLGGGEKEKPKKKGSLFGMTGREEKAVGLPLLDYGSSDEDEDED